MFEDEDFKIFFNVQLLQNSNVCIDVWNSKHDNIKISIQPVKKMRKSQ